MGGGSAPPPARTALEPRTSFLSRRINQSTFLIIEDDNYREQPYIYVKIFPDHLLITDTGCHNPRKEGLSVTGLREYLEIFPIPANSHLPLNPKGIKKYIIICSHCHYDHILGIPQFSSAHPTIIASNFNKDFLRHDFSKHSLCKYNDAPTPSYAISHWASNLEYFSMNGTPFRIQFLHVPGHTPDSLAWYDIDEHHLYVGDTFYERARAEPIPSLPDGPGPIIPRLPEARGAIIFPVDGNLIHFMSSLDLLLSFVTFRNLELERQGPCDDGHVTRRVKVGCGHLTHAADAEEMIVEVRQLFQRLIAGKVPVIGSETVRGVVNDFWLDGEDARYSVKAPRFLAEEARKHFPP